MPTAAALAVAAVAAASGHVTTKVVVVQYEGKGHRLEPDAASMFQVRIAEQEGPANATSSTIAGLNTIKAWGLPPRRSAGLLAATFMF